MLIYIQKEYHNNPLFQILPNCIYHALNKKEENNVTFFNRNNFPTLEEKNKYIFILFIINFDHNLINKISKNHKIYIIQTESLNRPDLRARVEFFKFNPSKNIVFLDYQHKNIKNFGHVLNIEYCPWTTSSYLKNIIDKIPEQKKEIDVLFYGYPQSRRVKFMQKLLGAPFKFKICKNFGSIENQIMMIKKSKIVLGIFFYDYDKVFPYYRFTPALMSGVLCVSEDCEHTDLNNERQLLEFKKHIPTFKTIPDMLTILNNLLKESDQTLSEMGQRGKQWFFKNFNYDSDINKIIT
jgi:hypothetical protein